MYSFFEEAGTIHPGNVGEINIDTKELLDEPIKISQEKISFIAQYLSDKSLLSGNIVADKSDIKNVGVGLEKISKIKDIQDNINEKYEKDIQRSAALNESSKGGSSLDESSKDGSALDESSNDEGGE